MQPESAIRASQRARLRSFSQASTTHWLAVIGLLLLLGIGARFVLPGILSPTTQLYVVEPVLWLLAAAITLPAWLRWQRSDAPAEQRRLIVVCLVGGALQIVIYIIPGLLLGFQPSPQGWDLRRLALQAWAVGTRLLGIEFARWFLATPRRQPHWLAVVVAWSVPWLLEWAAVAFGAPGSLPPLSAGPAGQRLAFGGLESLLATYMVLMAGPLASLAYRGTVVAFQLLSPFLPNLTWPSSAFVVLGVPLVGLLLLMDRAQQRQLSGRLESMVKQRTTELSAAIALLRDEVAERERAEEQLRRRNRELAVLNEAASIVGDCLESSRFLPPLQQLLAEELGIRAGGLYRYEEGRNWLTLVSAWGLPSMANYPALPAGPILAAAHGEEPAAPEWLSLRDMVRSAGVWPLVDDPTEDPTGSCIPLHGGGRLWGAICFTSVERAALAPEDAALAGALCRQIGLAMHNATLYDEVRTSRRQLQALSRNLVEAQESERRRIARELHDEAGQALTSFMARLRLLEWDVAGSGIIHKHVSELGEVAESISESLHRLATDLRPASLDHLGLVAALRQYAASVEAQGEIEVDFEAIGLSSERLPSTMETALFRIVQEALNNVQRHARAQRADVLLEQRGDRLIVVVEDDGLGFSPAEAANSERLGLLGMRERAEALGATLTIESSIGAGTTIAVEVPLERADSDR